jgi:uncharacterized protein (DUF433 family)
MEQRDRIADRADAMSGRQSIRDTRVTVGMIVTQIAPGHTIEDLLAA